MKERVIIVHRWEGGPENDWYPWLAKELEQKGYNVDIPAMPNPDEPTIAEWVHVLSQTIGTPNMQTHLIGHSVGAQTIMRYLETISQSVGKVFFVAPWFTLTNLEDEETEAIAKPWVETPINFCAVKSNAESFTSLFSDDDMYVPLSNTELFKERLNAHIIIEHTKGHFMSDDGITELPSPMNFF